MPEITLIDPAAYSNELRELILSAPLPPVDAGTVDQPTAAAIQRLMMNGEVRLPPSCKAGLWLLAGDLERSHTISQSIKTAEGSFWHGIMHRREGDYSNAQYWMHDLENHPVNRRLIELRPDFVDPFDFIYRCQRAMRNDVDDREAVRQLQWMEWQLLFDHCLQA